MQPYQRASEELQRQAKAPEKALKSAVGAAASIAGGGAILNRVLPFLNQYIPDDLMQKGLSKIDPRIGKFIERAKDLGYGIDEIKSYMSEKMNPNEETKGQVQKNQGNPLQDFETNYPELAQGLMNTIQQGQSPQAAAAILKTSTSLGKMVKKLEKETGKNFVDYVLELLGPQTDGMQQQAQNQQQQQQASPNPQAQGNGQQQAQGGQLDQQIMAALDKILKM